MTNERFNIVASGATAEILLYDEIGSNPFGESVTASAFAQQLGQLRGVKRINVRMNSPGGSVFDATAIYNSLKAHSAHVTITIEGMALSAASLVAMAGDTIRMATGSYMMIHSPSATTTGNSSEMAKVVEMLAKVQLQMVKTYATRTKQTEQAIAEMLNKETWMTPAEAVALGFADEVISQPAIAASHDPKKFTNAPEGFKRMTMFKGASKMSSVPQSYRAQWEAVVAGYRQTMPASKAVSAAVKQHPDLHRAMLQEANPGKKIY